MEQFLRVRLNNGTITHVNRDHIVKIDRIPDTDKYKIHLTTGENILTETNLFANCLCKSL